MNSEFELENKTDTYWLDGTFASLQTNDVAAQ